MAESSVFPVFIKVENVDGGGLKGFNDALATSLNQARRTAEASVEEIQQVLDSALNRGDYGTVGLRQSAAAADERARSARQLATAMQAEAAAAGDYSAATQLAIVSQNRMAAEQEKAAATARLSADALERSTAVAQRHNIVMSQSTQLTRGQQQANIMLGQQLMDVAIQAQLGINPLIILTQQGSQAAYAFTNAGGKVGAFARAISSPLSAAVLVGVTVLSTLIGSAEETADALEKVKFSSDAVGSAQGVLGTVLDITTGKMKSQRTELIALALAQIKVAEIQARARADVLRGEISALQDPTTEFGGGLGGGFSISRKPAGARGVISSELLVGKLDADTAIQRLDNLRKAGALTEEAFAEAAKSIASFGVELANQKVYQSAERLIRGVATGTDRSLLLRTDKPKRNSGAASKTSRLDEFGSDTRDRIESINREWDAQPRLIDRAGNAMAKLDDIAEDLAERKPKGWEEMLAVIERTRDTVRDGLSKPFDNLIDQQSEQLRLGDMALQGREVEAEVLRTINSLQREMGPLTQAQRSAIDANVAAMREQDRLLRRMKAEQSDFLDAVSQTRSSIQQTIFDLQGGKVGNAFSGLIDRAADTAKELLAKRVTDKLFAGVFDDLEDQILGRDKLKAATDKAATSLDNLARAADNVVARANGAANDNGADGEDIVVNGKPLAKRSGFVEGYEGFFDQLGKEFKRTFGDLFEKLKKGLGDVFGKVFDGNGQFGQAMGQIFAGAQFGGMVGNTLTDIFGIKGSKLGGQIGGAIGTAIGGPLGSIIGGTLGSVVGGLFKTTPRAAANIGVGSDGRLTVTGVTSNKKSLNDAAEKSGNQVVDSVMEIASKLGGTVNASRGKVSIGISGDSYHVDTTGRGRLKKSQGGYDFNDDYAAAVRFATLDLIKDGVIEGIRASTQRLLQAGDDLDAALQKALSFESVFTRLKEYEDPVGAAIDALDNEFRNLKDIFLQAGASTEEYASLEKLYGIERAAAVKEAGEKVTASLEGLFDDLTTNNDALSLRTRKGFAQATYDGLATRVAAGDKTAYDDFSDAARTLLDIERQIGGSTTDYFSLLDQVTNLTKTRIDAETNVASIAAGRDSLFGTTSANSVAPIVSATEAQTAILSEGQRVQTAYLSAMSTNIVALNRRLEALGSGRGSDIILRTGTDNF